MKITLAHIKEVTIYTAMTFGGLIVDMGTSTAFVYLFGWPLLVAGACGLLTGAVTNYFIHLKVTFKHRQLTASWQGLFRYLQTCLIGAVIRLAALTMLGWLTSLSSLFCIIIATGLSFAANYILSRFYVFRPNLPKNN